METDLYDTNVLINAYQTRQPLDGSTTILNIIEFPKGLELNLQVLLPSKSDYVLAVKLSKDLLKTGKPIPAVDIIIAAIALNRNLRLITKDGHFNFIRDIREDFKASIEKDPLI